MATPPLPPECQDCGQQPREGRSARCPDCRARHRRSRQTETQRERRITPRPASPAAAGIRPETVPHGTDPEIQARLLAVTHALRYSIRYTQHLHQRIGPTPYLDDLHASVIRLIEEMERNGYQRKHKVRP